MNKKIISALTAGAMMLSAASVVFADKQNSEPDVFVNGSKIQFDDQNAMIKDSRTLVPVRGVFEALGWKVYWSQENLRVTIDTKDNRHRVQLFIGDKNMKLVEFKSITDPDISTVELEVAPEVINNRTMVPLRAISEALNANVDWDNDNYSVIINTIEEPAPEEDTRPILSISSSQTGAVKAGEEFDVYVNAYGLGLNENKHVAGVTAELEYEPSKFEISKVSLCPDPSSLGAVNPSFTDHSAKVSYITVDKERAAKEDGAIMKFTMKSLTGESGAFRLTNNYHSKLGFNTTVLLSDSVTNEAITLEGPEMLNIDTSVLTVGE